MVTNGNGNGGRPKIEIDIEELKKLCHIQCSEQEVADWFHCSVDTIERRLREKLHVSFAEFFTKHRVTGKIALRRNMFKMSEKHPSMAIFLAQNWLGMSTKSELANPPGESFKVEIDARNKLATILSSIVARAGQAEGNTETQ